MLLTTSRHRHSFRLGHLLATATKPEEWFAECSCGERAPVDPPLHHYQYPRPYWYWGWPYYTSTPYTGTPYWGTYTVSNGSTTSTGVTYSSATSSTYELNSGTSNSAAEPPTFGEVKCTCPKADCPVHGDGGLTVESFIQ